MSTFARFPARLQQAIVSRLGWTALRPVQELAGEAILDGKNVIVLAPTAGGKTEAAIFPILANLAERPVEGVGAIYIAPIKALLNNQDERLGTYTEMVGLRRFVWHGDVGDADKRGFVKDAGELLMTTPESLEVMLISPRVPVAKLFADLRFIVIDEVHALAGTDRGAHLMSVLERVIRSTKNDVQRIGLSATVGNPDVILEWLRGSSSRERAVIDPPKQVARRQIGIIHRPTIEDLSRVAADQAAGKKSLFFCQSRALAETVAEQMRSHGTTVFVHHSSVSAEERREAEASFHHGTNVSITCTSTLELGIDVGDLDSVFQANAPSSVSSFLQRLGRTGRRENAVANTTFFCDNRDAVLQAIALVELARAPWVESVPRQTRCWPVLVHQVFAMALQFGGISAERAWEQLARVPDFAGISRDEFDRVIRHLVTEQFLWESGGLLSLGERAERTYGRKNFAELYAVFSSPVLYRVQTAAGREIGSLEQNFVDRLVADMTSFLLGGRAWVAQHVDHKDRVVKVGEAPRGRKPTWGGFIPQMLGFELCQRIRAVLVEDADYPYLDPAAQVVLRDARADLGALLRRSVRPIQVEAGSASWWTFAGGRINATLKYVLAVTKGWRVVADNFLLRIEGDGVTYDTVNAEIDRIVAENVIADTEIWQRVASLLPEYRLSKFQPALPDAYAVDVVAAYLLDGPGTLAWCGAWHERALEAESSIPEKERGQKRKRDGLFLDFDPKVYRQDNPRVLKGNPYDQLVCARLLEFFGANTAWHRGLWDVGSALAIREALEASEAVRDGALSPASCGWLCQRLRETLGRDVGAGRVGEHQALERVLKNEKAELVAHGIGYRTLHQLLQILEHGYLKRWSVAVRDPATRAKPERTARYVASHLLDAGFSPGYLHRWLTFRVVRSPETFDLSDLLEQAAAVLDAPEREYEVLVALSRIPAVHERPPGWLQAGEVSEWLRRNGSDPRKIRQVGGWILPIRGRDAEAAVSKAAEEVARVAARVTIGTRSKFAPLESAWVKTREKPLPLRRPRRVEVRALEREGQLYAPQSDGMIDNAFELLGPLDDALPGPAVAAGWAAVESLLHSAGDERVLAGDRLASLVACSFPRAELTELSYVLQSNGNLAIAEQLAACPTNRDRAQRVARAIGEQEPLVLSRQSDVAAVARMRDLLDNPRIVLMDVEKHARSAFRRLYRHRNLVLHWGKVHSVALLACLRTVAPLVGAGVDRIAHAHFVSKKHPLDLAARARLQLDLLGGSTSDGPLGLLED